MSIVFLIAVVLTIADVAGIHRRFLDNVPAQYFCSIPSSLNIPTHAGNLLLVIYYNVTGFNVLLLRGG